MSKPEGYYNFDTKQFEPKDDTHWRAYVKPAGTRREEYDAFIGMGLMPLEAYLLATTNGIAQDREALNG